MRTHSERKFSNGTLCRSGFSSSYRISCNRMSTLDVSNPTFRSGSTAISKSLAQVSEQPLEQTQTIQAYGSHILALPTSTNPTHTSFVGNAIRRSSRSKNFLPIHLSANFHSNSYMLTACCAYGLHCGMSTGVTGNSRRSVSPD